VTLPLQAAFSAAAEAASSAIAAADCLVSKKVFPMPCANAVAGIRLRPASASATPPAMCLIECMMCSL
jgi:hypothetical protein